MPYPNTVTSHLSGSGVSVAEPEAAYRISNNDEDYIGLATIDSQLSESVEPSVPDASQPVTPSNTICNPRNAQAAFDRIEFEGLTQTEIDSLAEYALFIKSRRK